MYIGSALFLAVSILLTLPAPGYGQNTPSFKTGVHMVYVTVTARDAVTGRHVIDLEQDDFVVYENGIPQQVVHFTGGMDAHQNTRRIPARISLLIDMSSSMRSRLADVQRAALLIIRALRTGPRPGTADDDLARIVLFHDRPFIVQDFTADRTLLEFAALRISDGDGTQLYTSLYAQLHEMEALGRVTEHQYRSVLVVLSDGVDTSSLHRDEDVIEKARSSRVATYTVLMPPITVQDYDERRKTEQELLAENFMRRLAAVTGGTMYEPATIKRLPDAFRHIADEIAVQYHLGYQPAIAPDGSLRTISVHTPERPNTLLRHRPGYRAVR